MPTLSVYRRVGTDKMIGVQDLGRNDRGMISPQEIESGMESAKARRPSEKGKKENLRIVAYLSVQAVQHCGCKSIVHVNIHVNFVFRVGSIGAIVLEVLSQRRIPRC